MGGLYQRALEIQKRSQLTVLRQEDIRREKEDAELMPPEERENVLKQIDGAIANSRTVLTPERLQYRPRRRGYLLVLVVYLAVVVLVAAGILAASTLLDRQEASIAREPERILTTESKVIAALKEESDQQLRRKDQEILSIAERLQQADAERQRLGAESQKQLEGRESALRSEYEEALRKQREELEKGGFSEAEIAVRLRRLEAASAAELDRKLAEAREAARKEREAQEATIAALVGQYQSQLQGAQAERARLQTASQQRVAELERQLAQRTGEAERATSAMAEELRRLQQQHENERLVLEQLASSYERAGRLIESGSFEQALQSLSGIRTYLDQQNVATLPTIQRRRAAELFIVSSLEELVRSRRAAAAVDTAALIESANLLAAVADLVRQGEASLQAGDRNRARVLYQDALDRIPATATASQRIAGMDADAAAARRATVLRLLGEGYEQYRADRFAASVGSYRTALATLVGDQRVADQVADTLQRVGYRLMAADEVAELQRLRQDRKARTELASRLEALRGRYAADATRQAPAAVPGVEALAELLQTKVLLLKVLDRDEVRTAYPELAGAVDRYLSVYGAERYEEGRQAAFAEIASILDGVAPPPPAVSGGSKDPVLGILDRLVALVKVQ